MNERVIVREKNLDSWVISLDSKPTFLQLEDERSFAVKHEWFVAYLQGNALWPQVNSVFDIFCFNELLQDMPFNVSEFMTSKFTDAQVARLGQIMSQHHHKRGITVATEAYMKEEDRMINDERLLALWSEVKAFTLNAVISFKGNANGGDIKYWGREQFRAPLLKATLHSFEQLNEEDLMYLRECLKEVKASILSEEGIALSRIHKMKFDRVTPRDDLAAEAERLRSIYGFSKSDYRVQMQNMALKQLNNRFPGEDGAWLGLFFPTDEQLKKIEQVIPLI